MTANNVANTIYIHKGKSVKSATFQLGGGKKPVAQFSTVDSQEAAVRAGFQNLLWNSVEFVSLSLCTGVYCYSL